jgi:cytidylate kinase
MSVIAISRQIGAAETAIAPVVAQRLGWKCIDHEILDREVAETGAGMPRVTHFDEHAPGLLESWAHPKEAERYFRALQRVVREYAEEGNAVLVGRGAGFILRGADTLHARLIADMPFRLKRVMELRWASESRAREIIKQNDHDRAAFHRRYFELDWNDPLQYDLVIATSRAGIDRAVEMLVAAATARWPSASG